MARRRRNGIPPTLDDDPLWYKDALIYELHVRAFHDSDGDGVGDFPGLVEKLDYLQDLGVTALWLLPFYPSPLRDDGYDIADYRGINPAYGSLADFELFLQEAHRRGLRVITELVVNHTSDQHAWFRRARRAPAGSPERDFYVWSDTAEKYQEARIIFKDFEPSNWTWDPVAGAYYWHRFFHHQPDLNFDNPAVHQAVLDALDFWLRMGIDGLRLDAIPYLYERQGTNCENLPETHAFLKKLRKHVDETFKNRMLLAEANQWPEDAVAYFGAGDECNTAFHFPVMPRLFMGIRMEDRLPIVDILQQTPPIPETCQWALFLRNHDELTLEMVTDEDRDYMYRVYAQDPQARINLGIRRRLAPLLENHRARIELMNGLLLSLPGTPVLYYGDEIGMGDNIYLGDRNGVRTPMQWSGERNAGFSRANPQRLYLPIIIDPAYHYEAVNVEAQQNNPHSLLWWMKRLIALRRRYRAFGRGSLDFLHPDNHKVLAFLRRYEDETLLVVANLSRFAQAVELDLSAFPGMVPVEMLGRTTFPPIDAQPYRVTLGPRAFYWFSLEPRPAGALPAPVHEAELLTLEAADDWRNVFKGKAREALAEALAAYLPGCPWFRGRRRTIDTASVLDAVPLGEESVAAHVVLVRVEYTEGDPETYVLPVAFAGAAGAAAVGERLPHAGMARLRVRPRGKPAPEAEEGILFDPLGEPAFCQALLRAVRDDRRVRGGAGELAAWPLESFAGLAELVASEPAVSLMKGEQSNTSVTYGDRLILKVFRRDEPGVHPELEVGRFLQEQTSFRAAAPVAGAVEYRPFRGEPMTLAVLHGQVAHQGDAWGYTRDSLGLYFERALMLPIPAEELPLPNRPLLELAGEEVPVLAQEVIGSYLASVQTIGERTAELHLALASDPNDSAFAPEPFTTLFQRSQYQSLRSQARQVLELLRKRLPELPEELRGPAREVLEREATLLERARTILDRKIGGQRTRTHSDYHLAQLWFTGRDFVVIDFEGDSSRPLSDRRHKRSPLRDVASMLRSFDYATQSALTEGGLRPEDALRLGPWARLWQLWVSVGFVRAYLAAAGGAAFLPANRNDLGLLLDFHLLKRAVYELRSGLTAGSPRVRVPLQGLRQMLATAGT
ncbi:MAG TPA: maltose alpha-D-glucosyltransferase [Gemmataceae bacterium]|nr:maltose alpha-D-glucosyltransferase [Gemmataceae bacterium]